jgi:hypothetical protein
MADHRETFSSIAYRYRRFERIAACGAALFVVSIALSFAFGRVLTFLAITAFLGWLIVVSALLAAPKLICPGCQKAIYRPEGDWCPCCGERSLNKLILLSKRACSNCRRSFTNRSKSRVPCIRYCTHCSSYLDEKGL